MASCKSSTLSMMATIQTTAECGGLFFKGNVGGPRRPPLWPTHRAGPDSLNMFQLVGEKL